MPEEHAKLYSVGVKEVDKLPCVNRNGKQIPRTKAVNMQKRNYRTFIG